MTPESVNVCLHLLPRPKCSVDAAEPNQETLPWFTENAKCALTMKGRASAAADASSDQGAVWCKHSQFS